MRPVVEIVRLEENEQCGTFGVLKINKEAFCWTLEPRDEENAPNISSIPCQQYTCRRVSSPKYGETFEVCNVPGRTHVLFHSLNWVFESKGCIGLGKEVGYVNGRRGLINSAKALEQFLAKLDGVQEFSLTIQEHY